ncbi:MAG: glycoside hydrolase family 15 protein [Actinobacteria bacterium]|nr:glycoside hydrolase family 15 protein [Actinomycetota bacterium]
MSLPIEDYAVIGDTHTAALVGRNGSIDWLCLPRFDSPACFSRLLGTKEHGYFLLAPAQSGEATPMASRRRYRGDSLVLETEFDTPTGTVRVVDCMAVRDTHPELIRLVEGVSGRVEMEMELVVRFGYGSIVPWVRRLDGLLTAVGGPDALSLWSRVHTKSRDLSTVASFSVSEGQVVPFVLSWFPSHHEPPRPTDGYYMVEDTQQWWQEWAAMCTYDGQWRDAVVRSLITLKALTYAPTGGIVAAATTSLPEALGGSRNWDYRYCWLRDATLTLDSLMRGGYHDEALAWRDWLLRAVAGDPSKLQIMYGPAGERRLEEWEVEWLPGYEKSSPVRIGNAASGQYQLDVYGEVMNALHEARVVCEQAEGVGWDLQVALLEFLEGHWREPDDGIWEVRGPRRNFTHSKVMAWVAFDRAVQGVERCGMEGPLARWKAARDEVHREVCEKGFNTELNSFTQYYGSKTLDASLLMIPLVGFLPGSDKRMVGTVEAIQRELTYDGFVLRYRTDDPASSEVDGLTGREGAFLACSFWMADCLNLIGRHAEARSLFEKLLGLRNDLGLLAEEYDPVLRRQVGNFPQAFSHVSLVNSACNLSRHHPDRGALGQQALLRSSKRRSWQHGGRGIRASSSVEMKLKGASAGDSGQGPVTDGSGKSSRPSRSKQPKAKG